MNREIKFRGKVLESNEWVYGFYMQGGYIDTTKVRHLISGETLFDVNPETVGQFTGLHDKFGKEIYEGDLVDMMRNVERSSRRVMTRHVVTCYDVCDWSFESLTNEVLSLMMANHSDFDAYRFEVVGNIHDNPGLVKKASLNIPKRKPRRRKTDVNIEFITKNGVKVKTNVSQETAQAIVKEMVKHS